MAKKSRVMGADSDSTGASEKLYDQFLLTECGSYGLAPRTDRARPVCGDDYLAGFFFPKLLRIRIVPAASGSKDRETLGKVSCCEVLEQRLVSP